ncbi:MAG: very short patch repair endonuclease [Flavobacterium sp.]|nr:very short patch repair endonuclease [Aeromicrobium sp.]
MSRMPRANTKPEIALRRELHRRGMRFRIQVPLPGRPDIALTKVRVAVFVDGCFWHVCPDHSTAPKNNRDWWRSKLDANVARDRRNDASLRALGWLAVHIWEHEDVAVSAARIERLWRSRLEGQRA